MPGFDLIYIPVITYVCAPQEVKQETFNSLVAKVQSDHFRRGQISLVKPSKSVTNGSEIDLAV